MAQTSIIVTTTDTNNKKLQKTFTYANANASSSVLKSVAQQLNALTTNTYEKTDRIDRINCDTEEHSSGTTTKPAPTLEMTLDRQQTDGFVEISYNGDGTPYLFDFSSYTAYGSLYYTGTSWEAHLSGTGSLKVGATEGTNYAAATPITITILES